MSHLVCTGCPDWSVFPTLVHRSGFFNTLICKVLGTFRACSLMFFVSGISRMQVTTCAGLYNNKAFLIVLQHNANCGEASVVYCSSDLLLFPSRIIGLVPAGRSTDLSLVLIRLVQDPHFRSTQCSTASSLFFSIESRVSQKSSSHGGNIPSSESRLPSWLGVEPSTAD